jgi:ABC-type multidrug transport system ATPase subunit
MDLIANRKNSGACIGQIVIPKGAFLAYVTSHDIHIGEFTIFESLVFSAQLRLGRTATSLEINERCRSVISMVGLDSAMNTVIGTALSKGISGGQMRRLTIATELLASPSILCLDEPTTGCATIIPLMLLSHLS